MSETKVMDSFQLDWDRASALKLLGDRLYREPFISGLQETIKNSKEEGATSTDVVIEGYDRTILVEKGGKGIDPTTFKRTIGTVFTRSKDEKHFGIGRLGFILTHAYTDYLTVRDGIVYHWRIMSDGKVEEYKPILKTDNDDFTVKIIGYDRLKNGYTDEQIHERLEQMFGLVLYKKEMKISFNGKELASPLDSNIKTKTKTFEIAKVPHSVSIYWKEYPDKEGFSVTCENEIGVRLAHITGVIVYFDQEGYLQTTMNREDFQKGTPFNEFMKIVRETFQEIIPKPKVSDEAIVEMWKKIFPLISKTMYSIITTAKQKRGKPDISIKGSVISNKTRLNTIDFGDEMPFLWFDKEQEMFVWNISHTITVLLNQRYRSRKGRIDIMAVPITRCQELIRLSQFPQLDWDKLKELFTNSDAETGQKLKKAVRKHDTIENEFES